jgi:hypothetical protein
VSRALVCPIVPEDTIIALSVAASIIESVTTNPILITRFG